MLAMSHPVRIVLVEASHPGNLGAVARAMKNMGLVDLWLVAPRQFPHPEATALASSAADVLEAARVVDSVPEALSGCGFVLGTTARVRTRQSATRCARSFPSDGGSPRWKTWSC